MVYYKVYNKDGSLHMIGTRSFHGEQGIEISKEEYDMLLEEIQSHSANVQNYVEKVKTGGMTLDEVPAGYRAEVEAIINAPEPEAPNNPYGIPNETYNEIRENVANEILK